MDLETFWYYTAWHHEANRRAYDAPADPKRLVAVAPDAVTDFTNELALNWGLGRVQGGDWDADENREPIRETTLYRGLEQRFVDGRPWEDTALYDRARDQFAANGQFRGYGSLEAFRTSRCEYLDELYRSIDREGYRPNRDASHERASEDNPFEDAYANHLEPLVAVGRDGEIYWTEGFHRFTIASILGVEEIPVLVLCRHEHWQRIRDRIHESDGDLPADLASYRGHPDLGDLSGHS